MNLFGTKKAHAPAPKLSDSIAKLRNASEALDKREKHLQKSIDAAVAAAKVKARAKDKRGALFQLKRKKMLEKQIDQIYGKKTNLEMQILALESTINNKEIFDAMKEGKTALNNAINENDIDKMEDVMGDINESMVLADEFGEVMSQQIGPAMDEDELEAELADMENELLDADLLEAPTVPSSRVQDQKTNTQTSTDPSVDVADMPSVPEGKVNVPAASSSGETAAEKEARELKELEALMGM